MTSVFPKFPLNKQEVSKSEELEITKVKGTVDSGLARKIGNLVKNIPGRIGAHKAYQHYILQAKKAQQSKSSSDESSDLDPAFIPDIHSFRTAYSEQMRELTGQRLKQRVRKRNKIKNHGAAIHDNSEFNASGAIHEPQDEDCGTAIVNIPDSAGGSSLNSSNSMLNVKENQEPYPGGSEGEKNSLLYDRYLAELYERKHQAVNEMFGQENCVKGEIISNNNSEISDKSLRRLQHATLSTTAKSAWRDHILDQVRPVLSHEISDFKTPYMMKRSAHKKLLKIVARNPLEHRLIEQVLNRRGDLIKARVQADMPPEALEPLFAFLGHREWNFDARTRLEQQLDSAASALEDFEREKETLQISSSADDFDLNESDSDSESKKTSKDKKTKKSKQTAKQKSDSISDSESQSKDSKISNTDSTIVSNGLNAASKVDSDFYQYVHPYDLPPTPNPHQSDGFISQSPRPSDLIGSMRFGKPQTRYDKFLAKKRYPTLQHTINPTSDSSSPNGDSDSLPKDPTYRSHVLRSIRILERNPGWDIKSKFDAIDTLKEVYDHLEPSDTWRERLDNAIPVNCPSKWRRSGKQLKRSRYAYNMGEKNAYYRDWWTSHDNSLLKRSKLKV